MQLKADTKRVEILLDDKDLNEVLSGRSVSLREISANDLRPIVVRRWMNPELKVLNRANDIRGIEILTGKNPVEELKKQIPKSNNVPAPLSPLEVNSRPFALEDKEYATQKSRQEVPFSKTGETTGEKIQRKYPSEFGRGINVQRRRKIEAPFNRSEENRQEADNDKERMVGEDNQGSESQ